MARRGSPGRPRRAVSTEAIRKDILVFVEGKRTEETYVVFWHRICRAKVNVRIDRRRGAPRQLVDWAAEAKARDAREARRGQGRPLDEVWCFFDVDQHPKLDEVRVKAEANGIHLAISNPCLELWFVLHFEDRTANLSTTAAQAHSEKLLGCRKTLSDDALAQLEARHPDARSRAQALDHKHEDDGSPRGHNPSSAAWRLVDTIRDA